jgi:hypothetical protein
VASVHQGYTSKIGLVPLGRENVPLGNENYGRTQMRAWQDLFFNVGFAAIA